MRNHNRVFRPLRGGIEIFNPRVARPGTLGMIATSDGVDRWIVSCFHVLCTPDQAADPIYQPIDDPDKLVAAVDPGRADRAADLAAARVTGGVDAVAEILGLPPIGAPLEPEEGMRVLKSGAVTGVTEGVVTLATPARVEIELLDLPSDYELSDEGDSGAVWVTRAGARPVALHQGGAVSPRRLAYGRAYPEVLRLLRLQPVQALVQAAPSSAAVK